ncbi:hypothetical protein CC2G_014870 [Coprinopsis cinerea AmutBmut pab1-1]|nr:hypothetical protein CC2G_014870 [Coprinopsis cinerea AmutBmut pab1-1]
MNQSGARDGVVDAGLDPQVHRRARRHGHFKGLDGVLDIGLDAQVHRRPRRHGHFKGLDGVVDAGLDAQVHRRPRRHGHLKAHRRPRRHGHLKVHRRGDPTIFEGLDLRLTLRCIGVHGATAISKYIGEGIPPYLRVFYYTLVLTRLPPSAEAIATFDSSTLSRIIWTNAFLQRPDAHAIIPGTSYLFRKSAPNALGFELGRVKLTVSHPPIEDMGC